jgi:hypothetical protein
MATAKKTAKKPRNTPAKKAAEFRRFLDERGACSESKDWLGKKTLRSAWMKCETSGWLKWLVDKLDLVKPDHNYDAYQKCWCYDATSTRAVFSISKIESALREKGYAV